MSEKEKQGGRKSRTQGLRHKAAHDARTAALSAVSEVLCQGADSQAALDNVLASTGLMPTDKRLCTELVYGVLRHYLLLKGEVEKLLKDPEKLPEEMRLVLVSALYEMFWMRIPVHATVNSAVQHIRNRFGSGLAGVANAVLRNLQRDKARLGALARADLTSMKGTPPEELSKIAAMPQWIVGMWLAQYGEEETLQLLAASQKPAPSGLRLNIGAEGWKELRDTLLNGASEKAPVILTEPGCLSFESSLPWQTRDVLRDGRASRQSAASYQALFFFDPRNWKYPVWDACAGRGGKTLALAESGVRVALATDASARRLRTLPEEYTRLELEKKIEPPVTFITTGDAFELHELVAGDESSIPEKFGTILLDAPCSGLGTLAHRPEIRLRRSPGDLSGLVALQARLMDAAWEKLLPGGSLVYLTCTRNRTENQEQAKDFIARHAGAIMIAEFETPADSGLREFFYGVRLQKST